MEYGTKTMMMRELSEDDLKGFDFSNMSPFDIFDRACSVAHQILRNDHKINLIHPLP